MLQSRRRSFPAPTDITEDQGPDEGGIDSESKVFDHELIACSTHHQQGDRPVGNPCGLLLPELRPGRLQPQDLEHRTPYPPPGSYPVGEFIPIPPPEMRITGQPRLLGETRSARRRLNQERANTVRPGQVLDDSSDEDEIPALELCPTSAPRRSPSQINLPRATVGQGTLAPFEVVPCPICYEDIVHGDIIMMLGCNHRFHEGCLMLWLERKETCPDCRRIVI
ncbi:hypothetical protein F4680DRAFT_253949 [Xylaria scruposa]|nr:hypothetical protein F4680DRAFT_253949 [Xylaria scruposa]